MTTLSIGKSLYSITIKTEGYPVENSKSTVNEKMESSGGTALVVSYLLGKWQVDSYFAGTVGYDDYANSIKKDLESVNTHTTFLETNYEKKTTQSLILSNKVNKSKTEIMIEPMAYHLKKYDFDFNPDVIYTDGYEYTATMETINKYSNVTSVLGASLTYNNVKEILAIAKRVKYVIFSRELAEKMTSVNVDISNPNTLLSLYKGVKSVYPDQNVIINLGLNGVVYAINDNVKYLQPIKVNQLDSTGSDDIFDGAFVYGLAKGYDIEKCIRIANIASGLSNEKEGILMSVPSVVDVINYYEARFGKIDEANPSNGNN